MDDVLEVCLRALWMCDEHVVGCVEALLEVSWIHVGNILDPCWRRVGGVLALCQCSITDSQKLWICV